MKLFFPFLSLRPLLKNWPGRSEIEPVYEEEFIYPIKNDCVTENSVYSVTVKIEIKFKFPQLLSLTQEKRFHWSHNLYSWEMEGTGLELFSFLLLRSIVIFHCAHQEMVIAMQHITIYM